MSSAHVRQLVGLLLGCVTACAHPQNGTGASRLETFGPASAIPQSILLEEDVQRVPGQPIEELLSSRFAGVETARTPRGGLSVHIRGVGSILSSNEALVVVDGEPIDLHDAASLRALNPRDIASIEVIKDPAALALYGVRGSNGVIVITTKLR